MTVLRRVFARVGSLAPALRWALLGFCCSTLGNTAFEGSVVPSLIVVSLPVWVLAARKTFMTVIDFFSPVSAWLVGKIGGFRALALTEGVEGVLSVIPLCVPVSSPAWKWVLFALSCALLVTGQVIDIAGEVFEVDMAGGDEKMLVDYGGIIGVLSSVLGGLIGSPLGAWIASWSVPAVLVVSAVSSFAAASTRLLSRTAVNGGDGRRDARGSAADDSMRIAQIAESAEAGGQPPLEEGPDVRVRDGVGKRADAGSRTRVGLLLGSLLLALVPASAFSYVLLGLGDRYGTGSLSAVYLASGVGEVVGALVYAHSASRKGMRCMATLGVLVGAVGLSLMLVFSHVYPLMCAAFLVEAVGSTMLVHAVVVSRQILFSGKDLARFSGRSRFMYAVGATGGSWIGYALASSWQVLPLVALVFSLGYVFVVPQLPQARE